MTAPQTVSQFLNTLGVNVHVEYTDGKYANAGNVVADLAYLGETQVRDAVLNPSNQGQSNYDTLAAAGIKFDFFFQGTNLPSTMTLVDAFVARHSGSVALIEGPNEVNNFPITYGGQSGDAAAMAYQNALYAAIRSDAHLSGVPVADLTSYPFLQGASDDANYHFYPFGGQQALATYGSSISNLGGQDSGKPVVMTEGGWNTASNETYYGAVDELTQAKLTLNLYCDNAKAGVATSYVYQLLSAYPDTTDSNSDDGFGLFHLDNTPKIAATAIHNLTTVLSAGAAPNAAASSMSFEMAGLPNSSCELDLAKSATTHDILLWNEPSIWNATTHTEIPAAAVATTLHFDNAVDVSVFDPLQGTAAVANYSDTHDVTVSLTDHPLVIEASIAAPVAAATGASSDATPLVAGAIMGSDAADSLVAGSSSSTLFGLSGNDTLQGGAGADTLFGNAGNDSISAGDGADIVFAGKDNDVVFGDGGADMLFGNLGSDTLHGGTDADTLFGGQGDDVLFGDAGDDWLSGDLGNDTLTGGAGSDTFAFAPGSGHDVVTDFTKGQDRIDISAYLAAHDTLSIADDATGARVTFSTGDTIEVYGVHGSTLSVSGGWIL